MAKSIHSIVSLKDLFSPKLKEIAKKLDVTEQKLKAATNTVKKFQGQLGKGIKDAAIVTAAGVAAMGVGLATVGYSWVQLASDAEETNNKVEQVFGQSARVLKEWSKTSINTMGLAGQSALDSAALFGDMGRGMGMSEERAAKMAMSLTQLSADLASFKNVRQDVAKTALNGIFSGETESLKQLGIVMTEANLQEFAKANGIRKKIKDMKEAEKVELRYQYVLSKTKLAQGDFARTGGGAANQSRMFQEIQKNIGANLGKIFLPEYTKGLTALNKILVAKMPMIQNVVSTGFNAAVVAVKALKNNLNWIIPVAGGALTAIMAYQAITGVVAVITTLKNVIAAVNTVQGVWNALLLANPIGLVAVGVGVLVGVIALLVMNWDKVTAAAKRAWGAMKKAASVTPIGIIAGSVSSVIPKKSVPGHALGTSYFQGGLTRINEGGRGETAVLPSGARIESHDVAKKSSRGNVTINLGGVHIGGNVLGNEEYANYIGGFVTNKVMLALANI